MRIQIKQVANATFSLSVSRPEQRFLRQSVKQPVQVQQFAATAGADVEEALPAAAAPHLQLLQQQKDVLNKAAVDSVSEPLSSQCQGPPLLWQRAKLFNPLSAPSFSVKKKDHVSFFGRSLKWTKSMEGEGHIFFNSLHADQ